MFVSVATPSAEFELRSLSLDDVQAACDSYPFATSFVCLAPSVTGAASSAGGCSYSGQRGRDSLASALAVLALALAFLYSDRGLSRGSH
jgi:hypothetical protein